MKTVKFSGYTVKVHEPSIVAQSSQVYERNNIPWGPYQFPDARRFPDGTIEVIVHEGHDSIEEGAFDKMTFVSSNNGASYSKCAKSYVTSEGYIMLGNSFFSDGTPINCINRNPCDINTLKLPKASITVRDSGYLDEMTYYFIDKIDGYDKRFCFDIGGEMKFYDVGMPNNVLAGLINDGCRNVGTIVMPGYVDSYVDENDVYWGVGYQNFYDVTDERPHYQLFFIISEDHGKTFKYRSTIPYCPDPSADPEFYADRDGFTESTITFLPNGNVMCLMRTTDQRGIGPMYCCISSDRGYTWPKPEKFSSLGVRPRMLTLGCGVVLASYGRPGVVLRTTADREGIEWNDEITIVGHEYTCGYTALVPLSDTEALMVYSDFIYPDANGVERKTVLASRIEITME